MAFPRRNRSRLRLVLLAIVFGVQLPAIVAVGYLSGHAVLPLVGAVLISAPFLFGLRRMFEDRPKSFLHLYLGLWPFFFWWATCLAFDVCTPLVLCVGMLAGAPLEGSLRVAGVISLVIGLIATRRAPHLVRVEVPISNLPTALDGVTIVQLSDLHCGSYTPPSHIARWVKRVNALDADFIAITGDLISSGDAYVAAVTEVLGGLRARRGVFACLGNHDYFTDCEALVAGLEARGITVLRNRGQVCELDGGRLFVAGVDDTWTARHDVRQALESRPHGVPTLLLAHDPNLFPQAAEEGVELTLSGHTHGGQLAVPGLPQLNMARIIGPFTVGLYRVGESRLYVSRGAGTTGPPLRFGARAEISLLTLRAPSRAT